MEFFSNSFTNNKYTIMLFTLKSGKHVHGGLVCAQEKVSSEI